MLEMDIHLIKQIGLQPPQFTICHANRDTCKPKLLIEKRMQEDKTNLSGDLVNETLDSEPLKTFSRRGVF